MLKDVVVFAPFGVSLFGANVVVVVHVVEGCCCWCCCCRVSVLYCLLLTLP